MGTSEYEKVKQIQSHQTEEKQTWKYLLGVGHIHEHEKSERIFHMYEYIVSQFFSAGTFVSYFSCLKIIEKANVANNNLCQPIIQH